MKIAIYGNPFHRKFSFSIVSFFRLLHEYKVQILLHTNFYNYLKSELNFIPNIHSIFSHYIDIPDDTDFMFSIGGDGTFLEAVSYVRRSGIPIVGINSGRLGFLADISEMEISTAFQAIFNKNYTFEKRSLLELVHPASLFSDFNYALNEITIHKSDSSSMIIIHTYLDDEFLNSYWADGLIISTPTGSTAYSLSVGGPIVMPNSENFIIAPIASHNLTVRPLIISDQREIRLKVEGRSMNFLVSLDSKSEVIESSFELKIRKADFTVNLLRLHHHSYLKTLRSKLMWGLDKRN